MTRWLFRNARAEALYLQLLRWHKRKSKFHRELYQSTEDPILQQRIRDIGRIINILQQTHPDNVQYDFSLDPWDYERVTSMRVSWTKPVKDDRKE